MTLLQGQQVNGLGAEDSVPLFSSTPTGQSAKVKMQSMIIFLFDLSLISTLQLDTPTLLILQPISLFSPPSHPQQSCKSVLFSFRASANPPGQAFPPPQRAAHFVFISFVCCIQAPNHHFVISVAPQAKASINIAVSAKMGI